MCPEVVRLPTTIFLQLHALRQHKWGVNRMVER